MFHKKQISLQAQPVNYTQEVKSAFLQAVYDKGDLPSVSNEDFLKWLMRLKPLLLDLSPNLVTGYFNLTANRNCTISQDM